MMRVSMEDIKSQKIIAIIRGVPAEYILDTAKALVAGGVRMMEITFDQSSKEGIGNTLTSLELLKEQMQNEVYLGAGTVLTAEQVRLALEHGAGYVISPNVNAAVIQKTKELGMLSMPGALTPTEMVTAYQAGADIIKLFPAGVWGCDYIKSVCAPLSHIPVSAVGGVNEKNIADFFKAGVCCVGVGNNLISEEKVRNGKFTQITETARLMTSRLTSEK